MRVSAAGPLKAQILWTLLWCLPGRAFRALSKPRHPTKHAGRICYLPCSVPCLARTSPRFSGPSCSKQSSAANEAVGLKGGLLHRIAKPNAIANTTAGYRGILVQFLPCPRFCIGRCVTWLCNTGISTFCPSRSGGVEDAQRPSATSAAVHSWQ